MVMPPITVGTGRDRLPLSMDLIAEMFARLRCGIFGDAPLPPTALKEAIWIDGGYCIDAPDEIPAGSLVAERAPDELQVVQWGALTTVPREPEAV